MQERPAFLFPAFFLSIGLLIALHIKRKETPINLILLAAFTVVEAYTVGVLVTFFDQSVVIQAFFLTAAVVIGLTAFTFQVTHRTSYIVTSYIIFRLSETSPTWARL